MAKYLDATGLTYLWGKITGAFQAKVTASGILKGNGSGGVSAATPGTDYVASESDPTVPSWAKASSKPTYTYSEVGAAASSHNHAAGDINSGTLGVGRGGTGATTFTSGALLKGNGTSAIAAGPVIGSSTTTYLRNDGSWATPTNTTTGTTYAAASVPNNTTFGTNGSIYNVYNATKHATATASLAVASWNSSNQQSVTVSGVTASNLVVVSPAPSSWEAASSAGVRCYAQGSNSLSFACKSKPSVALIMNVVIWS